MIVYKSFVLGQLTLNVYVSNVGLCLLWSRRFMNRHARGINRKNESRIEEESSPYTNALDTLFSYNTP